MAAMVYVIPFALLHISRGSPLGRLTHHLLISIDASFFGWGAVCDGQGTEVLGLPTRLPPTSMSLLGAFHNIVRTDSTVAAAYVNRQRAWALLWGGTSGTAPFPLWLG